MTGSAATRNDVPVTPLLPVLVLDLFPGERALGLKVLDTVSIIA